ncbi:DUF493 domain-containing protein [Marinomonas piezotolerans]|uniref:DUF493 domain-containing protein n=1 Tax=Marinomonas piezotolerans TaxID=2213058 RepID=A0A370U7U7_9GAMM|nr:DUF493 domain-containing protein [Marinomonas piezotolerans]RDL43857.1 DUF493 domain-containing protein [Marinomonas piezotolerans]
MALISKTGDIAQGAQEAPKIEFPCANYLIKVVAMDANDVQASIMDCVRTHAADFDESTISAKHSSKGRFVSYSFRIHAQSERQLSELHVDLMAIPAVKMVI